ncbi:hypothetical protein PJN13_29335, partial [Mycobacterium kansasii]
LQRVGVEVIDVFLVESIVVTFLAGVVETAINRGVLCLHIAFVLVGSEHAGDRRQSIHTRFALRSLRQFGLA